MISTGVIVEYNPFHNGHLYHIKEIRKKESSQTIVAVMSGSFLQRGEPALTDKWTRAEMAIHGGVDLVIELPTRFATGIASEFATGAVQLLHQLKVNEICFGSEDGKIEPFLKTASTLIQKEQVIQKKMQSTINFKQPFAQQFASEANSQTQSTLAIEQPNNSLGLQYCLANLRLGSPLKMSTIGRTQAQYHDEEWERDIASATAIRKALFEGQSLQHLSRTMPTRSAELLIQQQQQGIPFGNWELFYPFVRSQLLTTPLDELRKRFTIREGIEHRLVEAASFCSTFQAFMQFVKTKRYTWASIQRMLTHILLHHNYEEMDAIDTPTYGKILAFNNRGQRYLKFLQQETSFPLFTNRGPQNHLGWQLDQKATALYTLITGNQKKSRTVFTDHSTPPYIL